MVLRLCDLVSMEVLILLGEYRLFIYYLVVVCAHLLCISSTVRIYIVSYRSCTVLYMGISID